MRKFLRFLPAAVPLLHLFFPVQVNARPLSGPDAVRFSRFFRSGYYFYNRRNYNAAASFFDKARGINPRDYRSRLWLGQSFFMAGFYKNALTEWQIALNLGGGGNLLRNKLNYLYYQQGRERKLPVTSPFLYLKSLSGYVKKATLFLRPSGITVDNRNRILIAGFKSGSVVILNPNGSLLQHITAGLKRPYDVAVSPDGGFFVSDFAADKVYKYNADGDRQFSFGGFGYRPGKMAGPEGLYCDKEGNVFVVDSGNCRVQKFSPKGKLLLTFGKKGRATGEFFRPADVVVVSGGRIIVSDTGNRRLQQFDRSGNFLSVIGTGQLYDPRGLQLLSGGRLAIADGSRGVVVYNPENSSWTRLDSLAGRIDRAVGVAADSNDHLYVTDFNSWRVGMFVPERLKYVNLDLRITRTLEHSFPAVQHYLMVRDREGRPIRGLTVDNFRVYEKGTRVHNLSLSPTFHHKDRLAMVMLVDKHTSMQPYKEELQRVMRGILKTLSGRDRVQVVNFNNRVWVSQKYISNILSPLHGAGLGKFSAESSVGKAVYKGVGDLFRYSYRPALVLFTTADFGGEDVWKPYGFKTCLHYARNNGIPVYVVLFGQGQQAARVRKLAEETGGRVFDALTSNSVMRIKDTVMRRPLSHYAIYYSTDAPRALRGRYRQFTIEVRYRGLFGYDRFGYFVPR